MDAHPMLVLNKPLLLHNVMSEKMGWLAERAAMPDVFGGSTTKHAIRFSNEAYSLSTQVTNQGCHRFVLETSYNSSMSYFKSPQQEFMNHSRTLVVENNY